MSSDKMLLIVKLGDNPFLVNRFREICDYIEYHKCGFDTVFTEHPKHAWEIARDKADEYDTVISVGGDGTLNEVVNGVLSSENPGVSVGVLPLGSGNDFVRNYGIKNHYQALDALLSGNTQEVDIGCAIFYDITASDVGVRYYCNLASVGIGANVVRNTDKYFKKFGGTLGYFLSVPWTLMKAQCFEMDIKADSLTYEGRFWEVQANLGVYVGGGMKATPHAKRGDGLLAALVVKETDKIDFLKTFLKVYRGTHLSHPKVEYSNTKCVGVIADDLWVNLDGEIVGKTPVVFSVFPKALRLRIKEF